MQLSVGAQYPIIRFYFITARAVCQCRAWGKKKAFALRLKARGIKKDRHTPLGVCRGENFAKSEYFSALPLMSKLNTLCGANANSRTLRYALRCGAILLTGHHDEKKTPPSRCLSW
jgi:hypothetical protein